MRMTTDQDLLERQRFELAMVRKRNELMRAGKTATFGELLKLAQADMDASKLRVQQQLAREKADPFHAAADSVRERFGVTGTAL